MPSVIHIGKRVLCYFHLLDEVRISPAPDVERVESHRIPQPPFSDYNIISMNFSIFVNSILIRNFEQEDINFAILSIL